MKSWGQSGAGVLCAGLLMMAGAARAHDLTCTKRINGEAQVVASTYPFLATFNFRIDNVHPTQPSILLSASDPTLAVEHFVFVPTPPVSIPVNGFLSMDFPVTFSSYDDCLTLAMLDGQNDTNIDNILYVGFDQGQSMCTARLVCEQPPPGPCANATRTLGFYKNHIQALQQCLLVGPIALGAIGTITTLPSAEGLLWGDPAKYPNNTQRSQLDRLRFLLARQTMVATCNQRLFGAVPTPSTLISDAVAALGGTNCTLISSLNDEVDSFNGSCDSSAFPPGFDPGPATPAAARALAVDPTSSSGQSCSP
ncbi:hypothetical protein LZ198_07250 [Myxococcus sp. K15C18031901]|uniref:hypothetical protein n=1 Tax=Myxococcus dinghuensis TaxID=2906761 RepID=UPI0020A70153|nr:hypothetical protein [Myxococcus dinghuensis]MCP3098671.1 hypothetical protein [Myxococcus dinghuensis]